MRTSLVTDYLEETVKKFPEKDAFTDNVRTISFQELRNEALHVAGALVQRGLFKTPIVIFMEKRVECIAAFLGVAYSGNFYTPIDTRMPENRIMKIIETLQPSLIITNRDSMAELESWKADIPVMMYEDIQLLEVDINAVLRIRNQIVETDILYVFFTSGSTGIPKGVVLPHRAVVNFIEWFVEKFSINNDTVFGNQVPLYFDVSVQDIYATLKTASHTYLMDKRLFSFPVELMKYMREKKINTIVWVPSALCMVANLKGLKLEKMPTLEKVLFCGEVMPNKQLNQWRKAYPDAMFVNLYGPTEACDAMMYYIVEREFSDDEILPIGKAIENVDVMVLGEAGNLVSGNSMGELCIRGSALAHGYYNNPLKTKEAFTQNPLNPYFPEVIYHTGDIVHYNEFGELVYDCRKDFQIKHLGHRVELGEIEAAVSSFEDINQNCCLYDDVKKRIVLFYSGELEETELIKKLRQMLPEYMIPNRKVKMDSLPLNLNGKIDRTKLRELL